jgi:hypothetical protein
LPVKSSNSRKASATARNPYNVTEDADLGIRLCRFGYRTAVVASSTYEEAPAHIRPWLMQRTRWFKGWMRPVNLYNPSWFFNGLGGDRHRRGAVIATTSQQSSILSFPNGLQLMNSKTTSLRASTKFERLDEHRELTTYRRLREHRLGGLSPAQTVRSTKLYHRQVYSFAYHRPKLALLRESRQHQRFATLADFLEQVPKNCPHDLFSDAARASQLPNFVNRKHLIVVEKENFATRAAALIIPSVGDNRLRHEMLQRFMLTNDSVTVAIEIPIWLLPQDIDALETEYGIQLLPEGHEPRVLTGHIDFVQVRNGAVHILDYKPDARTNKPIAQLTLYALALTRLAGLRLFDIKCAWFNEDQYCEFFPRAMLAQQS